MNFQTMQHQKLNYRIPFPSLLHIEENQIYQQPVKRKDPESDDAKNGSSSADQDANRNGVDQYIDLNLEYNDAL